MKSMGSLKCLASTAMAFALAGCLEVEQHPGWAHGQYDGKSDNLPQQVHFNHDRLAWNAALANRTHLQSEYGRMDQLGTGAD